MKPSARQALMERAIQAQCDATIARLQADLLMETLAELGENRRTLRRDHELLRVEAAVIADQRRQLQTLNVDLEVFCFAVAHDLRQPLLGAQLLLQSLPTPLEPTRLGAVGEALTEALGRIDGLLLLARLAHEPLEPSTVDVGELVLHFVARQRALAPGIDAEVRVQPGLVVDTDLRVAGLVFENLVSNAFTHGSRDRGLSLEVFGRPSADGLVIGVADRGPGLPADRARQLFEPFVRDGRRRATPGVGLGLALVQRGAQRIGGQAWYESRPGGGACFMVRLPERLPAED